MPGLVVLGLVGITLSTGSFYLAIELTRASSAVILATTPVFVAVGGHLLFGERLRPRQWAGVLCSALGVLTVTRGEVRLLEARATWATASPCSDGRVGHVHAVREGDPDAALAAGRRHRRLPRRHRLPDPGGRDPGARLPVVRATHAHGVGARLGAVVFQGTVGTLSHVWYYRGVQAVGPSVTAIFMNLQPLIGVGLAMLILGESVTWAQGLGAMAILVGVWMTTRR